jgi:hypothetical protein
VGHLTITNSKRFNNKENTMETLEYMRVEETGKDQTTCSYCMVALFGPEEAWVSKKDRYFCCRECVEQYDIVQLGY